MDLHIHSWFDKVGEESLSETQKIIYLQKSRKQKQSWHEDKTA